MRAKLCFVVIGLTAILHISPEAGRADTVLFLVNNSGPDVYSAIAANLSVYIDDVQQRFGVSIQVLADDYYNHYSPADVRALLRYMYLSSGGEMTGAILAGTIPYATYRYSTGPITPAPLYYEDFDAVWTDSLPGDGHFDVIDTDPWTNATEIWTAWWVPPTNQPAQHASYLNAYLQKLALYYSGVIEGSDALLFIGSNMTNIGFNSEWAGLLLGPGQISASRLHLCGVQSIDQDPMWGFAGVSDWIYPQDLSKSRLWNGAEWAGFYPGIDFTVFEQPHGTAEDVLVDQLFFMWNAARWKYSHLFSHGTASGAYYEGPGNYFTYSDVPIIINDGGANVITTSGCHNGNFRGNDGATPNYSASLGNVMVFSSTNCCVTFYGSASSQSTALFAEFHEELLGGLVPDTGNYLAKGYYRMRNSDIIWGEDHYFFRSRDDKVLLGNPFVTWYDQGVPTVTPTFTPAPTSTPTPTPDPNRLYLNDLYLVQHNSAPPGGNRYYQDTIIYNPVPSSGWDGGLMDLAVIAGYYDFGTGFSSQEGQIDPTDVRDLGAGAPAFAHRGAFGGRTVNELDGAVQVINRPVPASVPQTTATHAEYIYLTQLRKRPLDRELQLGVNQFTIISPDAMELGVTGLIAAFISHDPTGNGFSDGDPPTVACLDSSSVGGATANAAGQNIPCHPGNTDAGYFQPSDCALHGDSRTAVIGNFLVTVTYFNACGDIVSGMQLPNGLTGHGAPGWIVAGGTEYNAIDATMNDAIAYLEITVERVAPVTNTPTATATPMITPRPTATATPTPVSIPAANGWGILALSALAGALLACAGRGRKR